MRRILALIGLVTVATVVVPTLPAAAVPAPSDVPACAAYAGPWWSGWDIARGVALAAPTGGSPTGGYVVDGWGGLHPFRWIAGAPPATPTGGPWWPGWDIARGVAMMPDGDGGYVVDGWGGIHPFAVDGKSPPPIVASAYWPGWDIVRGIAIQADGRGGYVLDAFGGQHPFTIGGITPPAIPSGPHAAPYRPGVDWARGIARPFVAHTDTGVVIDGTGAMTGFGSAAPLVDWAGPGWPGWDIARGVAASDTGDTCALVVDGFGGLHLAWPQWTSAPAPVTSVAAGPGGGSGEVSVGWRGSARATGFRVQRATTAGGPFTTTADYDIASGTTTKAAGVTTVSYTDSGGFTYVDLPGMGAHYYRVVAYNSVGAAPASVVVCGEPVGSSAC